MSSKKIEVKFLSKNKEIGNGFYNGDEKVKTIFQNFKRQKNIISDSINLSLNGKTLNKEDYEKSISHFFSLLKNNLLNIQINNIIENSSNFNFADNKSNSSTEKYINEEINNYVINKYNDNNNPVISKNEDINSQMSNIDNVSKINNNDSDNQYKLSTILKNSVNNVVDSARKPIHNNNSNNNKNAESQIISNTKQGKSNSIIEIGKDINITPNGKIVEEKDNKNNNKISCFKRIKKYF